MVAQNIFDVSGEKLPAEIFSKLIETDSYYIERIISEGHVTPEGIWYDQETNEFVILMKGYAELEFEEGKIVHSNPLMWVEALDVIFDKLVKEEQPIEKIRAISGSGQQHGTVYLNENQLTSFKAYLLSILNRTVKYQL